ncbi:YqkA [Planococcus halocryophilus Or1]|uniref:Alanine acetyltransferase n=1 Tax=Planococcus halocryophilus TaxID=1215089 RepID=A0A1C7DRN6_9BACL|nr:GNAT family N-acetyltransferase [Planococcus halocryophilus]ANU14186.1 alanine acetyltransferase [Planococcus halocryophilus]EMF46084.1 YqkA [Planococcus halocryophilus Or1]
MITVLNHQDKQMAEKIQQIQQAAYRVEAELMGFFGIPQLHETIREIQNSTELFIGYSEEQLQGVLSYKVEEGMIDIHRLVVDPAHFRKGIGKKLLSEVLKKYRAYDFKVSTGSANQPAITLYKLFGFQETGVIEVAPGIYCTQLYLNN